MSPRQPSIYRAGNQPMNHIYHPGNHPGNPSRYHAFSQPGCHSGILMRYHPGNHSRYHQGNHPSYHQGTGTVGTLGIQVTTLDTVLYRDIDHAWCHWHRYPGWQHYRLLACCVPSWQCCHRECFPVVSVTGKLVRHKWENCMTVDRHAWTYRRDTTLASYLTIEELVEDLVTTVRLASLSMCHHCLCYHCQCVTTVCVTIVNVSPLSMCHHCLCYNCQCVTTVCVTIVSVSPLSMCHHCLCYHCQCVTIVNVSSLSVLPLSMCHHCLCYHCQCVTTVCVSSLSVLPLSLCRHCLCYHCQCVTAVIVLVRII